MTRKWNPETDPIGRDEPIGRRLFDEPMLIGAQNQPSFKGLDLRHFEETRDDQLSVDRLGSTGIEKKAKNYLRPRAEAAGAKCHPKKQFNGWAYVRADILKGGYRGHGFHVTASPVEGDESNLEDNTHHAHIVLGDQLTPIMAAFYLRELFTTHGKVEKNLPSKVATTKGNIMMWIITWLRNKLAKKSG